MALSDQAAYTGPQLTAGDPPAPDSRAGASRDDLARVRERIRAVQGALAEHLNGLRRKRSRWPEVFRYDPVRTKNLEKAANQLQQLLATLESAERAGRRVGVASLGVLLDQLEGQGIAALSGHGAWELADALGLELVRCADDARLHVLLSGRGLLVGGGWETHFPDDLLRAVAGAYSDGGFRPEHRGLQARYILEEVEQLRVQEFRRDRALAELRGIYLGRMVLVLLLTLLPFAAFFLAASSSSRPFEAASPAAVLLVLFAGAVGSVLSRAIKLGGQGTLQAAEDGEAPLGIRALYAGWKVFLAQPVIGAASAFLVYLVLCSKLLALGAATADDPAALALVAFLAGFSEPFFIGTLDRIAGQGGRKP
jgi:hypothetical protein